MDPNKLELMKDLPYSPNIPGVISITTYYFWFPSFTWCKMGLQVRQIGVKISVVWDYGVTTIEASFVFR
jgi:hypothetical protein